MVAGRRENRNSPDLLGLKLTTGIFYCPEQFTSSDQIKGVGNRLRDLMQKLQNPVAKGVIQGLKDCGHLTIYYNKYSSYPHVTKRKLGSEGITAPCFPSLSLATVISLPLLE